MSKRTYNVQDDPEAAPSRDASFRSCLCALLIFIAICIIIAVIGMTWSRSNTEQIRKEKEDVDVFGTYDKLNKDKDKYKEWTSTSTSRTIVYKKPNETAKIPIVISGSTKSTILEDTSSGISTTSTFPTAEVNINKKANEHGTISTTTSEPTRSTSLKENPEISIITTSTYPTVNKKTNDQDKILTTTTKSTKTTVTKIQPPIHVSTDFSVDSTDIIKSQTTSSTKSTVMTTLDGINKWLLLGNKIANTIPTSTTTVSTPRTNAQNIASSNVEYSTDDSTLSTIIFDSTDIASTVDLETTDMFSSSEVTESSQSNSFTTEFDDEQHEKSLNNKKIANKITIISLLTTTTEEIISEADDIGDDNTMEFEKSNNEKRSMENDNIKTTVKSKTDDKQTTLKTTTKSTPTSPNKSEPVCSTSGCKSAVSRMLSLMDHSKDACENFYEFSCGGMQADSADSGILNRLSRELNNINDKSPAFLRKFREFYDMCVAYEDEYNFDERIKSVRELLSRIGKMVDDQADITIDDITNLFAKLILSKSMPLMDIGIDVDKETSKYILQLTLPQKSSASNEIEQWSALLETERRCLREEHHQIYEPILNLSEIHETYSRCSKNYTNYLISINSAMEALEVYSNMPTYNISKKLKALQFVLEDDIFTLISEGPSEIYSKKEIISNNFIVKTISDLQRYYPLLNWEKLFITLTHHNIPADTLVQVYFNKHFEEMFSKLSKVPMWKLNNALLAIYANDLFQNLVVSRHKDDRESFCLKSTDMLFPDVSSYLYMKSLPKLVISNAEDLIGKIFGNLKANLIDAFHTVEWLDDASRISIIKKANTLQVYTPKKDNQCFTEVYLNGNYGNVFLNENYQANIIAMKETRRHSLYELAGETFQPEYMFCGFVNSYSKLPYSFYAKQVIAAPFGLIVGIPKNFPGYLSMARVGIHLAMEIARHFDPVGITHNMVLSDASKTKYDVLKTTLSAFHYPTTRDHGPKTVSFKLAEDLQLNTKIAENTAFRLVTNVYDSLGDNKNLQWISKDYPKEKAFFITVVQEYCQKTSSLEYMLQLFETELLPVSLRVENVIINSEKFSEVFRCAEGSKMNTNDNQKFQFPYIPKVDYDEPEYNP